MQRDGTDLAIPFDFKSLRLTASSILSKKPLAGVLVNRHVRAREQQVALSLWISGNQRHRASPARFSFRS
jgi:hypothetical protein